MSKSLAYQVAARARGIIADRKHWTRSDFARFKNGSHASIYAPKAVRFCAVGAIYRAAHELVANNHEPVAKRVADAIGRHSLNGVGSTDLMVFNDLHGHEAALAVFDRFLTGTVCK